MSAEGNDVKYERERALVVWWQILTAYEKKHRELDEDEKDLTPLGHEFVELRFAT